MITRNASLDNEKKNTFKRTLANIKIIGCLQLASNSISGKTWQEPLA